MKKLILTISIIFLFFLQLHAEKSELAKLKAEKEAAINKVIEKYEANLKIIDHAYLKKLQEMMKFFIKKGDLDGAVAARAELKIFREKLGGSDSKPKKPPKKHNTSDISKQNTEEDKPDDQIFGEEEF